ncbi:MULTISPECIES: hypothetical protein [Nocardiopsis]|uniref:hypothetical protein n=1 Tax=Nocardiopsis TaxID=2013 RepID=UPI00118053C5|nr:MULTISPECIES: hypothetical protein [Nocardiopsis]
MATPQQLCLRPLPFNEIYATSFRYMVGLGQPRSLDDVIDMLSSPVLPVEGVHYQIEALNLVFGRQKVVLDAIALLLSGWKPRPWC